MSRAGKYELVSAGTSEQLAEKVNEKIDEGWQPFGSPFIHGGNILQAMVIAKKMATKRLRKTSED